MTILKSIQVTGEKAVKRDAGRRSFLWKAGAALSAGFAAAVPGMAKTGDKEQLLKSRLARLEDENAIRRLHGTYEHALDSGSYLTIPDLFTDDAEVIFHGGIYSGKYQGISRLYREHFSAGMTGKSVQPAPGLPMEEEQPQDVIEVSEDGRTASARFTYSIQVGAPMQGDSVLVKMARLHGEGIRKWWEGGTRDVAYVKDIQDGTWKIARLEYRVSARADFKPGRVQARPLSVSLFDKVYPEDPTGPDKLVTPASDPGTSPFGYGTGPA